jgi:hypothetical protein
MSAGATHALGLVSTIAASSKDLDRAAPGRTLTVVDLEQSACRESRARMKCCNVVRLLHHQIQGCFVSVTIIGALRPAGQTSAAFANDRSVRDDCR